jgi:hypothetical protein
MMIRLQYACDNIDRSNDHDQVWLNDLTNSEQNDSDCIRKWFWLYKQMIPIV